MYTVTLHYAIELVNHPTLGSVDIDEYSITSGLTRDEIIAGATSVETIELDTDPRH